MLSERQRAAKERAMTEARQTAERNLEQTFVLTLMSVSGHASLGPLAERIGELREAGGAALVFATSDEISSLEISGSAAQVWAALPEEWCVPSTCTPHLQRDGQRRRSRSLTIVGGSLSRQGVVALRCRRHVHG
tara:strand:+ start:115 stop:516 length:402 start_codon:yes stop_codon:yes gene_type:complete